VSERHWPDTIGARTATVIACCVAACLLPACSLIFGRTPSVHHYTLGPPQGETITQTKFILRPGLVTGSEPYSDEGIAYQTSAYQLDSYRFHRWTDPPIVLVQNRLTDLLQQPATAAPTSLPQMVLDARIKAFQEVDIDGNHNGLVEIEFCMTKQGRSEEPLWCKTIRHQNPVEGKRVEGAIPAIDKSFQQVMSDLAGDINAMTSVPPD